MPTYESTHLMVNHAKQIEELISALDDALEINKKQRDEISYLKSVIENLNNTIASSDIKFSGK